MTKLILISGPPASGKTSFAKLLSKKLNIPYFSKDDVKESLFDSLGWSDREWSRKLGGAAFNLMYLILERELKAQRTIILESNFKPEFDKEKIEELVNKYSFKVLEFYFFADLETLKERFKSRVEEGKRHLGHNDHIMSDQYFDKTVFGSIEIGELVKIDTTDFSKLNFDDILQQAIMFFEK